MGCTPSKTAGIYSQDMVFRDMETSSTFIPNTKSSLSTPENPRLSVESSSGRKAFLSVPCRNFHGRSVSQSSFVGCWSSAGSSCCPSQLSMKACCSTPNPPGDTRGFGTASLTPSSLPLHCSSGSITYSS